MAKTLIGGREARRESGINFLDEFNEAITSSFKRFLSHKLGMLNQRFLLYRPRDYSKCGIWSLTLLRIPKKYNKTLENLAKIAENRL